MKRRNEKKIIESDEDDKMNDCNCSKNLQVSEDLTRKVAILKIYGAIEEPEYCIDSLNKLELMSEKYDVLEVIINSPGGSLNTMVDIISIFKHFRYIITIGKGECSSASFMLWALGNIRVVTDYSMYMSHRESYGLYGKTSEHRDVANILGTVYAEMFEICFGDLLTREEKQIAERSEVWISYKDLLKRDRVISYENYINPSNQCSIIDMHITEDSKMFIFDAINNVFRNIEITYTDDIIEEMTDYIYGICDITQLPLEVIPEEITELIEPDTKKTCKQKSPKKNVNSKVEKK